MGPAMLTYDMAARGECSLYEYLYRCIRRDIEQGAVAAHDRLPSKRALAAHLGVSLITVEQAYAQLIAEGYVYSRERSGYFASALPQLPEADARTGAHGAAESAGAHRSRRTPSISGADRASSGHACREAAGGGGQPARRGDGAPADADAPDAPPLLADFASGDAPFNEQAYRLWAKALRATIAAENPDEAFMRLPGTGSPRLRQAIASHLSTFRGLSVDPGNIVVGAGAQVLYGLVVQLLGRNRAYAVEDPGYPMLGRIYPANGARVAHIPMEADGISAKALAASSASVVHVMPSHQFPCGVVTSIARRYELLAWAAEAPGRYIIEDDYDCEFRLAGKPIPPLASIDAAEKVLYMNTFSRTLSPSLRVAYLVLPPHLMERFQRELGFYASTVSALDQVALARLIEGGGYERHINRYRTAHRALRDQLAAALREAAPDGALRLEDADSGLHCLLAMRGADEQAASARARDAGIRLVPLASFAHDSANYAHLRESFDDAAPTARFPLHYAGVDPARLPEIARALSSAACGEAPMR